MGCDIHCWAEKRVDGKWLLVTPQKGDASWSEFYNERFHDYVSETDCVRSQARIDFGRNYDAFAILADVRNGRGFAGIKTGDGFRPILAERRGWPEDRSAQLDEEQIDHSPSWLTLRELNEYDWTQRTGQLGVISLPEYVKWRDKRPYTAPEHYCGCISGPKVSRETFTAPSQRVSNQPLATHMIAEVRPKPNMARLTTSEPKCDQLPTEKTRMMPIWSAMMLPATSPTDR